MSLLSPSLSYHNSTCITTRRPALELAPQSVCTWEYVDGSDCGRFHRCTVCGDERHVVVLYGDLDTTDRAQAAHKPQSEPLAALHPHLLIRDWRTVLLAGVELSQRSERAVKDRGKKLKELTAR